MESLVNTTVIATALVGGCVLLLTYVIRMLKSGHESVDEAKYESKGPVGRRKETATAKSKKKSADVRWTSRSDKQSYTHPWLLTTLKGHSDQVLDMDFSSHGKYLASCSEEPDPGGDVETGSNTSSNSECNKENSHSEQPEAPASKGLSRRQRKNRRREENSLPETKKKTKTKRMEFYKRPALYTPLKQYSKLNVTDKELYGFLRNYLQSPDVLLALGYPVESELYPGRAIIFKSPLTGFNSNPYKTCQFDVNAREFVPSKNESRQVKQWDSYNDYLSTDSGQGSGSDSSDQTDPLDYSDSNSIEESKVKKSVDICFQVSEERECVRCGVGFLLAHNGEYLTQDNCVYHWGKLQRVFNTTSRYNHQTLYTCCRNKQDSPGCMIGKLHVWNGIGVGFNGPFDNYVRTKSKKMPADGNCGVYALDCEMCYTAGGLELAKLTVITADGKVVYDCFVKPDNDIIDYNTRFSGVTAKDLNRKNITKTLRDVQKDLLGFISSDTILVGHGLENDLRALKIIHSTIVDTAVTFPHYNGLPFRRSLKSLVSCFLKRDIQCNTSGHNSCEDARDCMDLMLWRVRKDFRNILEHN